MQMEIDYYTLDEAREIVIRAGLRLMESGMIVRTYGNISARISPTQFVITPSGKDYRLLTPDDLVICSVLDKTYVGDNKPSSEVGIHRAVYEERPAKRFIIHTHQPNASALSIIGQTTIVDEEERKDLGTLVPCVNYALSGTPELEKAFRKTLYEYPDSDAFLLRCHGAVCMGFNETEVFDGIRTLERMAGRMYEAWTGISPERLHREDPFAFTKKMSRREDDLPPYLDDMAMVVGTYVPCFSSEDAWHVAEVPPQECSAVLIRGDGARILLDDPEERDAAARILEKGCQAAFLGARNNILPLSAAAAKAERSAYLNSYRALKDK